jgi:hypothetical protein
MSKTQTGIIGFVVLFGICARALASHAPDWVQAQVTAPVPEHARDTDAVIMYAEDALTVAPNGTLRHLERRVFRILRPDGSSYGHVQIDFDAQSRIISLHGWTIPADGKQYEVGERDSLETGLSEENGALMGDVRAKHLQLPAAAPGSTIAYEVEQEERPYVMTDEWEFQERIPVREAHYSLQLPPRWQYKADWMNHAADAAVSAGNGRWTWTVSGVSAVPAERDMPPWRALAGRMMVALMPPDGRQAGFQSWRDLGAWYTELTRGRRDLSPQIQQKVTELTAAQTSLLGKLRVLAAFVQNDVRYVAIELGIGGYQPHPAADVFSHRYGDCKDKVTLLSAMLHQLGIESQYVIVNTHRGAVTQDMPVNMGFNHAIIAIELPESLNDPSLMSTATHAKLGRLLYFDPTNELTPIGRLSGELQGSYGLLVTADGGELTRLPQMPLGTSALERTAHVTLGENGQLTGTVHEVWSGDRADSQRLTLLETTQDIERIRRVEATLADSFGSYHITAATVANVHANDRPLEWNYTLEVEGYAKNTGNLLLLRPRLIGSKSSALLETREPRREPIEFGYAVRDKDLFEIALPNGFQVDELPPPLDIDLPYASYHSKCEVAGHGVRYQRTFEIKALSVPIEQAEGLRDFYRAIHDDERLQVVLKRTGS